jgi:hypothetical protein
MGPPPRSRPRGSRLAATLLAACLASGCASNAVPTLPVSGQVTLDGEPVTTEATVVLFKPDQSRGNAGKLEPVGTVDAGGRYTLTTAGRRGAPAGWYKVIVAARAGQIEHPKGRPRRPLAASLLPARYGSERTTPLVVEVVEQPAEGAYDLKLSK